MIACLYQGKNPTACSFQQIPKNRSKGKGYQNNLSRPTSVEMKALRQIEYAKPLEICDVPIPQALPGSAVVRILAASLISYTREVYDGTRKYPYPTPLTVGSSAIGRIHKVGSDATALKKDDLIIIDITFRSRDDPTHIFLSALHEGYTPGSRTLMSYWRDGSFAEYMLVPLENCFRINESVLRPVVDGGLGYTLSDLLFIPKCVVPFGGMADVDLRPGETVIIAPATGSFSGAAVHVALSLGARVIAMGRNKEALARLVDTYKPLYPEGRLLTVPITGNVEEEVAALKAAAGDQPIDVFFDISPPQASKSTHFKAAILALRHSGRVSMMGGQLEDVAIPHSKVMHFNIGLRGKWMYERDDVRRFLQLVEVGTVGLGERGGIAGDSKAFKLEEWKEAFDYAMENVRSGVPAYFAIGE